MTRTQIIDHLRAGLPVNAKLVKEIVAGLEKAQRMEDALKLISSGRGLVEDKSTVYMNGSSPVVQKHFNTRDMIEIAIKALEAACK